MKALLLTDYRELQYTDAPEPEIGERDVLVRVAACGICGSDVHGYDGSSGRRIPPLIMGHEAAGVIERIGSAVRNLKPGDRVTFDSTVSCGECDYCRAGRVNLCERRMVLGVSCGEYRRHGAFAELVAVPEQIVYKLPSNMPLEHAALIEAVSIAVHAVGRAPLLGNDCALVVGSGMIGLLVIQVLRHAGCRQIIALDQQPERLALAKQFGANETIDATAENPVDRIAELTDGNGVDVAYEVVGSGPTVETAIAALRKGGHLVLIGNLAPRVEVPIQAIVTRELTLHGSCSSAGEYPRCIELMASGAIDVAPLISATVPLSEGAAWFDKLYNRQPGLMKVVLQP
ncbi:MAG: galactitol-1-phosphate 5-dehydrogenase [Pirellulales bacterium]